MVVNFVLFQCAWFACVIAAARGQTWWGLLAVLAALAVYVLNAPRRPQALLLVVVVTLIGLVWDSVVLATGWLHYQRDWMSSALAPAWIIAMWSLFATLLNVSLRWLRGRWWLAAAFGLIGGPLAYLGGARLGAVTLLLPMNALLLQGVGWAVLTPLLIELARRYDV